MNKTFGKLLAIFLTFIPLLALAGYYEDDCYDEMAGSRRSVMDGRYVTHDDAGVKEVCRNQFKSTNERFILKREVDNQLGTIYKVTRSYCWARNWFRDNSCSWPTGAAWGDTYSGTFLSGDVRGMDDGEGRVVMRRGGYALNVTIDNNDKENIELVGSGLYGDHVCLKRFPPRGDMAHGGKNPFKRNAVCAYLVHLRVSDSCRNPVGGWNNALIGCIEEPLKAPPPTYNTVMAAEIAPFVDPKVTFEDYKAKYNSTFDQPVIKLLNGEVSTGTEAKGTPKVGELVLRYKFPGDTTVKDNLPASGRFPESTNALVYKAMVDLNNPGEVCACEASDCDKRLYIGCVKRPTPRDSNLKVVAEYAQHSADKSPGVKVHFALTDANHEIIYYDGDNQRVVFDGKGDAYKADPNGRPTSNPAKGLVTYKKLPLIPREPIREYYVGNQDKKEEERSYARDVITVYGVQFQAIIPRMQLDGTPAFVALDTAQTRTDGCNAIKIADNQDDAQKPPYFVPAGDRDRTYCRCVKGKPCPVPESKGCGAGMTDNEEDAAKVYCPGRLKEPSQVDKSNTICLQPASSWEFASYRLDKLCTKIPTGCQARPEPSISYGISAWGELKRNTSANSICDAETGIEMLKIYQWNPPTARLRNQFVCEAGDANCDATYAEYVRQFGTALRTLNSRQALANALNRNLNEDDQEKINSSLGKFGKYHALAIAPLAPPKRTCSLNKETAKDLGLVENPCMIQNSCGEINKPAYITGFATWKKFGDEDLNTMDRDRSKRQMLAEILVEVKGKCPTGYKEDKGAPSRVCSLKYVNTKLVGGGWLPVKNPCVPAPPSEKKKEEPLPKT